MLLQSGKHFFSQQIYKVIRTIQKLLKRTYWSPCSNKLLDYLAFQSFDFERDLMKVIPIF
jgi:hypothetical protein